MSLAGALAALGLDCRVEARERLAVIVPTGVLAVRLTSDVRRRIVSLAREHGFTHVAVEIPVDAHVRGGQS